MPHEFDKLGIRFAFPDNWSLEEQQVDDASSVTVSSPGGAFWWLAVHPPSTDAKSGSQTARTRVAARWAFCRSVDDPLVLKAARAEVQDHRALQVRRAEIVDRLRIRRDSRSWLSYRG